MTFQFIYLVHVLLPAFKNKPAYAKTFRLIDLLLFQMRMEVDRISYIFGSFTRRRQSQEIGSAKRRSVEQKICHDRSNSTPHTTKKSEPQAPRAKSVYGIPFDESKYKCPLCQRVFVEPRVLPCLHTFCIRCLQELEANDSSWSDDSNGK